MADQANEPVSDRPAIWHVVVFLAIVVGLSALVGRVGSDKDFSWELASVFGTAAGTTLLALATYWLAYSTRSELRATVRLANLTAAEQTARERPVVLQEEAFFIMASGAGGGTLAITLFNVGLGPALRVQVSASYDQAGNWVPAINQETVPAIAPNEHKRLTLDVVFPSPAPGVFRSDGFRVKGFYLDRSREHESTIITSWDTPD
jgi:hypothetical protein